MIIGLNSKVILFYRAYDAVPYCPTGFTITFWMRVLGTAVDKTIVIIDQASGGRAGINIYTYDNKLKVWLQMLSKGFYTSLESPECPIEPFSRRWQFIGLTYDPVTEQPYVRCNDYQIAINPQSDTSSTAAGFGFGHHAESTFLLDDIVYIPKFSSGSAFSFIQNKSKFFIFYIYFSSFISKRENEKKCEVKLSLYYKSF